MKINTITLSILLLCSFFCFSQNKKNIDKSYKKYFELSREIPYLHLNKTSFIEGEEIWFQAYILNQKTNKLHQKTTNLYCTIYNQNGTYKQSQLVYVKNGIASGNIKIDSTFNNNIYYIKASSNRMKNFNEKESFFQKINIINNKKSIVKTNTSRYDIQILPEGGHLVESTKSVVGLIVKNDKGKGVEISSGVLLDNKNRIVKKLQTNQFGIGKFSFTYKPNTIYKVKVNTFDNKELIKTIPPANKLGITLNVTNPNTSFTNITIKTNDKTLQSNINKTYSLYIHNTKFLLKSKIKFKKNTLGYQYSFPNKKLKKGINIITVFNHKNRPILERVFFNYHKSLIAKLNSKVITKTNDSIVLQLDKINKNTAHLSATFLPEKTESYSPDNSIISNFFLKPYIRGHIENSRYYFTNINRKKLDDLDLLLLTQGWSKYNWYNIFNTPPIKKFLHEKGITINGSINSGKIKDSTLITLFSPQNSLAINTLIIKNKFSFKNIYINDSSSISFSIQGKKKLKKPKMVTSLFPKQDTNSIKIKQPLNFTEFKHTNLKKFIKDRVLLNEITIVGKEKTKHRPFILGTRKRIKITDKTLFKSQTIFSYLTKLGFAIKGVFPDFTISIRGISSTVYLDEMLIHHGPYTITPPSEDGGNPILDPMNQMESLYEKTLDDFEEIHYTRNHGGEIHLYLDKVQKKHIRTSSFKSIKPPLGFANTKEYYQPKYFSTSGQEFNKFGAIFWKPNITLKNHNYSIKVPTLKHKKIKVFIEGITENGNLVSEEKLLKL